MLTSCTNIYKMPANGMHENWSIITAIQIWPKVEKQLKQLIQEGRNSHNQSKELASEH